MVSHRFPSSDIGYAVGWSKNIFKTSDAGNTWIKQNYSLINGKRLYSVYFINDNIGYAVGEKGVILKTTNGGSTFIDDRNYDKDVLQIYPNPTSNIITLELKNNVNRNIEMTITDIMGRVVYEDKFYSTQNKMKYDYSLIHLPGGIYFLSIKLPEATINKKIVIQK